MWDLLKSWRPTKGQPGAKGDGPLSSTAHSLGLDSPVHRHKAAAVSFRDATIHMEDEDEEGAQDNSIPNLPSSLQSSPRHPRQKRVERNKLIIIMVGLPGRGKTFLCNKVVCYLNWLGHDTRLFNVGSYRRLQKDANVVQNATFFDQSNKHGLEARQRALEAALADLKAYLATDTGQVAIFDATNTTNERRDYLVDQFHGTYQYLFIESVCNDKEVLEQNYRYKMKYSPDYEGMSEEEALRDFKARIEKYEEVYEPLENRTRHYIKLIDMVTGRGHMDINRISGYLPGKIVFFLMQVCKAGIAQERKIWLTRHGESLANVHRTIGGDPGLSALGHEYARMLPDALSERLGTMDRHQRAAQDLPIPVSVWTSTLKRTIETASYLALPKLRWKALDEIHAGSCDGLTYEEIAQRFPEEYSARTADKLRYRYPAGESYLDVIQRLEPVIIELEREKECVVVVAHQAVLRAVYGYFVSAPLQDIPTLEIPLHSLIELKPLPDGTMEVTLHKVLVDPGTGIHPSLRPEGQKELPQAPSLSLLGVGNVAGSNTTAGSSHHSRHSSTHTISGSSPSQGLLHSPNLSSLPMAVPRRGSTSASGQGPPASCPTGVAPTSPSLFVPAARTQLHSSGSSLSQMPASSTGGFLTTLTNLCSPKSSPPIGFLGLPFGSSVHASNTSLSAAVDTSAHNGSEKSATTYHAQLPEPTPFSQVFGPIDPEALRSHSFTDKLESRLGSL